MVDKSDDAETERIIRELDAVLPADIDRRRFLHGSLATVGAAMFAGCTGDGDDGDGGDGTPTPTDDTGTTTEGDGDGDGTTTEGDGDGTTTEGDGDGFQDDSEIVFTTPWTAEPTHGVAHVAELEGYWEDEGVSGVDAQAGNGSDTESQNIGVGNKEMGIASFATAVSVWPGNEDIDELDMNLVGMAKARPLLSFIYRTDELDGPEDLDGQTVLLASGFASSTWDMYPALVGAQDAGVTTQEAGEETGPPSLANNDVQAIWGSIDLLPEYEEAVDVELGVAPLTQFGAFPGFPIWVNGDWYENKENNVEYVAAVLTGYYKALKWVLTNQEEYLDLMVNEINTNLQTWTEEELNGQYQVFSAQAVNLEWQDEGIGYFSEDGIQVGLDAAGQGLLEDPSVLPSASELIISEPNEEAETVEFTDEEWDQLAENAGRYWDIFEEAESGN